METDSDIIFKITKEDIQREAIHYLGRELNEEEFLSIKKLLEFGIGENIRYTYWGIFCEWINKKSY